ncbi:hypothetical protein [Ruegeria profundi]|uniref:hypothetical protein n=1 Tax=Ruegeria profundi TaxID=1685378 RepID=UPI003C7B3CF1
MTLTATDPLITHLQLFERAVGPRAGRKPDVIPGMVAQVDMLSEPKTVLEYLTKPLIRVKDRAFRD